MLTWMQADMASEDAPAMPVMMQEARNDPRSQDIEVATALPAVCEVSTH